MMRQARLARSSHVSMGSVKPASTSCFQYPVPGAQYSCFQGVIGNKGRKLEVFTVDVHVLQVRLFGPISSLGPVPSFSVKICHKKRYEILRWFWHITQFI